MKRIPLLVLIFLAALTASAQTINFKLGAHDCSAWNGSYNCAGIPITNVDGSQPVPAQYNPATVQSFVLYNSRLNGVWFEGAYGLGNGVNGGANVTSYTVTDLQTTPASSRIDIEVAGNMLDGIHTYAGTVSYIYSVGVRHCSGGRGGGCSTPWSIAGGTGTITVMAPHTVANLSPIAPTPTSCPGCGSHVLAGVSAQSASVPPPGYGTCYGVQIVAGPWNAGPHETCAIYKGYCQVSQEGNIWNWIYWTDCATN